MLHKFTRVAIIGALAFFVFSSTAFAQSTILVVDTQKVIRTSDVGKHIARQLESIAKTMDSEVKAVSTGLESTGKNLELQASGKTREEIAKDAALVSQIQSFSKRANDLQRDKNIKANELKLTEAKALQKVNDRLSTILKKIVDERNADVVLERSLVIYGEPADVTDTVISRLNAQMKTVPVTRERLPQQPTR
jgi:outer membrane protein